jgi:Domain of unknown function (DUF397)
VTSGGSADSLEPRDRRNVMVAQPGQNPRIIWRKSSASAGAGECVEVASSGSSVLMRDSRDRSGVMLEFTTAQWLGLLRRIKDEVAAPRLSPRVPD